MRGLRPEDYVQKQMLERILPMFEQDSYRLYHNGKFCVPRNSVSNVLQLAHDSNISGNFGFSKKTIET